MDETGDEQVDGQLGSREGEEVQRVEEDVPILGHEEALELLILKKGRLQYPGDTYLGEGVEGGGEGVEEEEPLVLADVAAPRGQDDAGQEDVQHQGQAAGGYRYPDSECLGRHHLVGRGEEGRRRPTGRISG